jgi:hypothetical protein
VDDAHEAMDAVDRAAAANAEHRPVTITGDVVTRPASAVTATVHDYLRHVRAKGLPFVPLPRALAWAGEPPGRNVGVGGRAGGWHQHTDAGLASAARLLRAVHDAGRDWVPPEGAAWNAPEVRGDASVWCHGDPGPWNFVWQDQQAVGLIDWDYLHRGPRLDDVAYALQWFGPLRRDEYALEWHHFPSVPDRRHRVRVFLEAYGDLPAFDVVDAVTARMQATLDLERAMAEAGQEPPRTWVAGGSQERGADEIAWVREHRGELDPGS